MRGTTITINGQLYDARTGLPITAQTKASHTTGAAQRTGKVMSDVGVRPAHPKSPQVSTPKPTPTPHPTLRTTKTAHSIHNTPQRSKTLYRAALKRPEPQYKTEKPVVKRSAAIQKFAQSQTTATHQVQQVSHQQQAMAQSSKPHTHPIPTVAKQPEALRGSALKEKMIADKMANVMPQTATKPKEASLRRKYPRLAAMTSGIAALVLLGGYLTYLNLPNLSLRVAASQANVAATYPTYQPSGYSFAGPVAYSPGEVRVNFKSNTNDYAYSVVQRESNWDSQAVRDNYVVKESKQYTTIQEGGITIYLVNNKAVWVNGGVLYSVEGNAPLSGEQIQKIASSTL